MAEVATCAGGRVSDVLRAVVCGAIVVAIGCCLAQLDLRRKANRLMLAVLAIGMLFALLVEAGGHAIFP
jgi:hypothetical protein